MPAWQYGVADGSPQLLTPWAGRLLLSVVERRDLAKPEHRRLETRLIVRGSTGPVPPTREEVAGEQH